VTIAFCSDLHDWFAASNGGPAWDGDSILVAINRRGRDEVWRVPLEGEPHPISSGDTTLTGIDARAGRVIATACDDAYPPEVFAVENGAMRKLTRNGGAWLRRYSSPTVTEVDACGIPTWLVEPANAKGAGAMVLSPHGGPYGAHGPTPELDAWVLAELGYRSLLPNIRGSCGYGRDWIKPIQGRWGGPDADDLLTSVKWAVDAGLADPTRIAAMGLSYGGWAVNWLAGAAPDTFCAIVSENGVASMVTAHGASNIGPPYDVAIGYGPVSESYRKLWNSSPLRLADRITAPVLMLQGEADRICPLDDNQSLFVALRERGHDVQMALYPGGKHVMMATARPDRRIHRLQIVSDFLTRHCPPNRRR
jgi:dipeptidyl aminopeptidase/acylaminoacyl peptidase